MRSETSNIRELPEMHRMGHTCANLNGELLFFWGGGDDSRSARVAAKNAHLWIYETLTGYWRRKSCTGECPPNLSGSTSSLIGQKMYIFGGHSTLHDNWLNSLYCLNLETFIWKDLGSQANAKPSKPIRSDKCVSWTYDGRLYVFGGYGWSQTEHLLQILDQQKDLHLTPDERWPFLGWNNQLVEFDPRDNTWRWPSYSGQCPSARAAHSGALIGTKYYVFGGRDSRERLNDLYTLDMLTFEWHQIAVFSSDDSTICRPIGHLFDEEQDEEVETNDNDDDDQVLIEEEDSIAEDDYNHQDQESPHSSNGAGRHTQQEYINFRSASSDEEEDEDRHYHAPDYPAGYPHLSHLLERWSLSSHQSASSSSDMDTVNCNQTQTLTNQPSNHQDFIYSQSTASAVNENVQQSADMAQSSESQDQQQQQQQVVAEDNLQIEESERAPVGRSFSSFTQISQTHIMLYGGVSSQGKNLADCWVFDTNLQRWSKLDLKINQARLWHTGARTKNNEVIIVGGSCSDKVDEFCTDVLALSLEPKSLKKLSLDTVARSIRLRALLKVKGLPSNIGKLIKLRKQAIALTMRRYNHEPNAAVSR